MSRQRRTQAATDHPSRNGGSRVATRERVVPAERRDVVPRVRTIVTFSEEVHAEAGQVAAKPLWRAAAVAVISNPPAGRYEHDLAPLIEFSRDTGRLLGKRAAEGLGGHPVESYGKGGLAVVSSGGRLTAAVGGLARSDIRGENASS